MLMRDPEGSPWAHRRMSSRGKRQTVMLTAAAFTLLLIAISVVAFAIYEDVSEDSTGDSPAPLLSEDFDLATFLIVLGMSGIAGMLSGVISGRLSSLRSRSRGREHLSHPKKTAWRYREMSRREKRLLGAALGLSSSAISIPLAIFLLSEGAEGTIGTVVLIFVIAGTLGTLTGLVTALVQVRPSRTVMQIVEDRLRSEREQMARDLEGMRESDARQMEQWKDDAAATLYKEIMRQVDQGLITCAKCEELGAAHHAPPKEEPHVPAARDAEDASRPCKCGGPSSVSLVYFPPRFQSKRTAS